MENRKRRAPKDHIDPPGQFFVNLNTASNSLTHHAIGISYQSLRGQFLTACGLVEGQNDETAQMPKDRPENPTLAHVGQ